MTGARDSIAAALTALGQDRSDNDYLTAAIQWLQSGLELGDPASPVAYRQLARRLYAAGRVDLPLGRLFEGHIDALQIIARYGDRATVERLHGAAHAGACFGVWNAPLTGESLQLIGHHLAGGKAFASGAGLLSHALVSAELPNQHAKQIIALDLAATPPDIDRDWWRVLGMQRSQTHRVRWHNVALSGSDALIGMPGDYESEPWLSAGALRFVAVQAGGIAGLFDGVRDHLNARRRADNPHQAARLGTLYGLADSAAAVCDRTIDALFDADTQRQIALVANARNVVLDAGERALTIAQQSVGLSAFFEADPLSRHMADLMVYLRQPAPDAQRVKAGEQAAAGVLSPEL